jgi:formylglycine-generating enzyme required for sulfatase activity
MPLKALGWMIFVSLLAGGLLVASPGQTVPSPRSLEFVLVGDPGAPAEPITGLGRVSIGFYMGRHEITNAQYAQFLNAVAAQSDPHQLWHRNQAEGPMGFIRRVGESGQYRYIVAPGQENLPVVYVSWFSAARYCNWLHYGQPALGSENLAGATTEGDATHGAYDTRGFPLGPGLPEQLDRLPAARNAGARYWLPSLDEWIKAGFHQPGSGGHYWRYATQSDELPAAEPPPGGQSSANYYARSWAVPYPHLTTVGSYTRSASGWGTYDQAGNVMEWLETMREGNPGVRRFIGGAAARYATMLARDYADWENADHRLMVVGFRVAGGEGASLPATPPVEPFPPSVAPAAGTAAPTTAERRSGLDDFVPVDHAGNPPDPVFGHGAVAEAFEMARYELTNSDYAAFLSAVARSADPFELYETSMGDGLFGGIVRLGEAGRFTYVAKPGWENRPVTYLNWYRLARLANWLHFGRPDTGTSEPGTTEGDATHGAYDTRLFPAPGDDHVARERLPVGRNPGARYFLPTEDEWFKAAHYDPTRPGGRPYWTYPVCTDEPPDNRCPPGGPHSVNHVVEYFCIGMPFVLTEVGAFPAARSYFGTQDQGGNVWEWTESWRVPKSAMDWRANEATRVLRGGSATYTYIGVSAANADPGHPNHALAVYGGRMARRAVFPAPAFK